MLSTTQLNALQELDDAKLKLENLSRDWNVESIYINRVKEELELLSSVIVAGERSRYCQACDERLEPDEAALKEDTHKDGCSNCRL